MAPLQKDDQLEKIVGDAETLLASESSSIDDLALAYLRVELATRVREAKKPDRDAVTATGLPFWLRRLLVLLVTCALPFLPIEAFWEETAFHSKANVNDVQIRGKVTPEWLSKELKAGLGPVGAIRVRAIEITSAGEQAMLNSSPFSDYDGGIWRASPGQEVTGSGSGTALTLNDQLFNHIESWSFFYVAVPKSGEEQFILELVFKVSHGTVPFSVSFQPKVLPEGKSNLVDRVDLSSDSRTDSQVFTLQATLTTAAGIMFAEQVTDKISTQAKYALMRKDRKFWQAPEFVLQDSFFTIGEASGERHSDFEMLQEIWGNPDPTEPVQLSWDQSSNRWVASVSDRRKTGKPYRYAKKLGPEMQQNWVIATLATGILLYLSVLSAGKSAMGKDQFESFLGE